MTNNKILIIIPARYQSSRLPGKPLVKIAGIEMIKRVAMIAQYVCDHNENAAYKVATDDQRIIDFCAEQDIPAVMTSDTCRSGTERCWDAAQKEDEEPAFVINLQGDNPLCPPHLLQNLIDAWKTFPADVFTPCVHLDWIKAGRAAEREMAHSRYMLKLHLYRDIGAVGDESHSAARGICMPIVYADVHACRNVCRNTAEFTALI